MEAALTKGCTEQTLLPTSISPSSDPNERRLKGAIQSPAPSESKLPESGRVDGYNSHLCFESTHGKGSLMKLDIFLLALWVLSAVCWKWQLAGRLHWYWILVEEKHCGSVYTPKQRFVIEQPTAFTLHPQGRYWVSAFIQSWLYRTESLESLSSNYI